MQGPNVSDHTVMKPLDGLALGLFITEAEAGAESQALLFGQLGALDHGTDSRHIHRQRFLAEDMFASINRGSQMERTESRRSTQENDIHTFK